MKAVVFFSKKIVLMALVVCCLGLCGCLQNVNTYDESVNMEPRQITLSTKMDTTKVIEEVKSAVVGISCNVYGGYSVGSGVAIAENGYILTNQHVINGAKNIRVYFADKTDASANVIWQDVAMDLAVIRTARNLPYLECGQDGDVLTGEDVLAIGTPLTLDFRHTVTKGIVSALNRTLEIENSNGGVSYMQNLIQHDASINPGNSGGPLINSRGQVIGINTLKATEAEGLGFAIPIKVGKKVVDNLINNQDWNSAYMGVFGFDSDIARYSGEKIFAKQGVFVTHIDEKVHKSLGELACGDVIVSINNKPIRNVLDLRLALFDCSCGEKIKVGVVRGEEILSIECTLCEKGC